MSMEAVFESIRAMLVEGKARLDCPNAAVDDQVKAAAVVQDAAVGEGVEDVPHPVRAAKRCRVEKKFDSAQSHTTYCMTGFVPSVVLAH